MTKIYIGVKLEKCDVLTQKALRLLTGFSLIFTDLGNSLPLDKVPHLAWGLCSRCLTTARPGHEHCRIRTAFDTVSHSIQKAALCLGFPPSLEEYIDCLYAASCVGGSLSDWIRPCRGVRQGEVTLFRLCSSAAYTKTKYLVARSHGIMDRCKSLLKFWCYDDGWPNAYCKVNLSA